MASKGLLKPFKGLLRPLKSSKAFNGLARPALNSIITPLRALKRALQDH
jgi:hypothetical protein